MNTCKDCKHWRKGEFTPDSHLDEWDKYTTGFKEFPNLKKDVGSCCSGGDNYYNSAWVDYDTIQDHFIEMTGPDFGCIHWEKKDE